MQRQKANAEGRGLSPVPFPICDGCNQEDDGMDKRREEKVLPIQRLCKECNEKPLINPVANYCASCLAKRSHMLKYKDREPNRAKKKSTMILSKPQPERPAKGNGAILTIDFGKYAPILKEIKQLADQEMRPIEMQIIYILKNYFKGV